ncbi:predicted protein [Naegleria gruberi]|uniref:Predicted protein n=1 Tax=Naegleria gruberi TaxID=5762 RepID=D2VT81_NAEGR|nr:uncharacterized protein NAEGRDRAFT_72207 [Naegleria gruberi]EFC40037.1 predicted protein [Naegleria gruberi]|eukprot:XP_002672781.1 predicted protein [Naegleria gruberi strain NEG-M]
MGVLGKRVYRKYKQKYINKYFKYSYQCDFPNRKQIFQIQSPYLTFNEQYSPSSKYPQLLTPVTKTSISNLKLTCMKKPLIQIPTFKRIINRSMELSAPDIMPLKEEYNYNIVKLNISTIDDQQCAQTEFNGFRLTRDKLTSLTCRKWHSIITFNNTFKSMDGYHVRIFMTSCTRMKLLQIKKTSYANKSQIKKIRTIMYQVILKYLSKMTILEFVNRMAIKCEMSSEIRMKCENIYPLEDEILITKIKLLEKPQL